LEELDVDDLDAPAFMRKKREKKEA